MEDDYTVGIHPTSFLFIYSNLFVYSVVEYLGLYAERELEVPFAGFSLVLLNDAVFGIAIPILQLRYTGFKARLGPTLEPFQYVYMLLLMAFHLFIFPLGILGSNTSWRLLRPSALIAAVPAGMDILVHSMARSFLYWGVLLRFLEVRMNTWLALALTSVLFCVNEFLMNHGAGISTPMTYIPLTFYISFVSCSFTLFSNSVLPALLFFVTISCVTRLVVDDPLADVTLFGVGESFLSIVAVFSMVVYIIWSSRKQSDEGAQNRRNSREDRIRRLEERKKTRREARNSRLRRSQKEGEEVR